MAKYSKKAQDKVEKSLHEMKRGELKSGHSDKKVKSRRQAIAIGLSEAKRAGAKVPDKKASSKKSAAKKAPLRKAAVKKSSAKKAASEKTTVKKMGAKKMASKKKTTK